MKLLALLLALLAFLGITFSPPTKQPVPLWSFRSIDTVKYSRDVAREKLDRPDFDLTIDQQVQKIASAGASHVAIGTPYDSEFLPYLRRWVAAARKYHLNVWFRGNWSGWEGWFNYPRITPTEHMTKTQEFILQHPDLFVDGDVFTACTECENGVLGDPRNTGQIASYRQFLVGEYQQTKKAFAKIGKNVPSNFDSMNRDVAQVVMDKDTTNQLDGLVVIDHYVASPDNLAKDISLIAKTSGGKVILGEFGAPIPDIHGAMTDAQQAQWLQTVLDRLSQLPELVGLNYWVSVGGSTQLWDDQGNARPAANILSIFYHKAKT